LRKYEGEQDSVWGGDSECEHEWGSENLRKTGRNDGDRPRLSAGSYSPGGEAKYYVCNQTASQGSFCLKCGAWRGAFGLEPTPELYVSHTVLFLREIRRVLKDDGVVFWNIADSYAGGGRNSGNSLANTSAKQLTQIHSMSCGKATVPDGLKPKDMCLIPFRVALAAQADGWYVRSDIIWAKPNPMPESVRDRPTSSYEHIFLFTKSQHYYWGQDAVREPINGNGSRTLGDPKLFKSNPVPDDTREYDRSGRCGDPLSGRNLRDVWTIATQPSGFKHYAAFPLEIPTRCIKAATMPGDTVLDPFCGTGRTLEAAIHFNRKAIGYDVSEAYCDMATRRCRGEGTAGNQQGTDGTVYPKLL